MNSAGKKTVQNLSLFPDSDNLIMVGLWVIVAGGAEWLVMVEVTLWLVVGGGDRIMAGRMIW